MDLSQANRLAEMALDMAEQPDLEHTLVRIVFHAQQSIRCDAAGILMVREGRVVTAASTDDQARRADELQLEADQGPCLFAVTNVDTCVSQHAARDERWPDWGRRVAGLGFQAVLSLRLYTPVRTLGVLNLYSRTAGAFGPDDVVLGQVFGRHASIALMSAQHGESLRAAIDSRHVIGQAQGILMERYRIDADRAFTVLRRYSQDRNIKLRAIAEQVIATHRLPE